MRLSVDFFCIAEKYGDFEGARILKEAGYDCLDYTFARSAKQPIGEIALGEDYVEYAMRFRAHLDEIGIKCNQAHAPFPTLMPEALPVLMRAIECTAIAGADICIIHPDNNRNAEQNAEIFYELLPFAKEHGVRIATENMWNWNKETNTVTAAACSHHDDFLKHIETVNDPYLVACLDIGHAEMAGLNTSAPQMIHTLGKHLQALHIHDNDKQGDSHQIPFSMQIDWDAVAQALKEVGYSGYLTLEANSYVKSTEAATEDEVQKKLLELAASARRLEALIQSK